MSKTFLRKTKFLRPVNDLQICVTGCEGKASSPIPYRDPRFKLNANVGIDPNHRCFPVRLTGFFPERTRGLSSRISERLPCHKPLPKKLGRLSIFFTLRVSARAILTAAE